MTPEREKQLREQADSNENADPTEVREMLDAIGELRRLLKASQVECQEQHRERGEILRRKRVGLIRTKEILEELRGDIVSLQEEVDRSPRMININQTVKVVVTERGREILEAEHVEFERFLGKKIRTSGYKTGEAEFQLWGLMQKFGPHMRLGGPLPFETTIEVVDPMIHSEASVTIGTEDLGDYVEIVVYEDGVDFKLTIPWKGLPFRNLNFEHELSKALGAIYSSEECGIVSRKDLVRAMSAARASI